MERYNKLCEALKKEKIDVAVLTTPCNVTYSTGFEVPYYKTFMESMAIDSPMAIAVVAPKDGLRKLLASDLYEKKVGRCADLKDASFFKNYDAFEAVAPAQEAVELLKKTLQKILGSASAKATIGIEPQTCSAAFYEMITGFKSAKIVDVTAVMNDVRKIKTDFEILALRRAAAVMDVAQNTLLKVAYSEGEKEYTEIDIWAEVHCAINTFSGELLPFVGELVTGPSTALGDYPLGPKNRLIRMGDAGIMDVCPRVGGYWADTTNSVVFYAERNAEQKKYFDGVKSAFDAALDTLYPGKKCSDVEAAARKAFAKNGFGPVGYIGHEIGLEVNETPRLTCYDHTVIEPGMVFCIEPQQYAGESGSTGVRLEKMVLITKDGPEVLNHFQLG